MKISQVVIKKVPFFFRVKPGKNTQTLQSEVATDRICSSSCQS
ncbi:hypothetical protein [Okeania sp. SIO2B3]|nr:hypothetical protein [Okeania sp. SIO2B3]